jgi:hypothetical protein
MEQLLETPKGGTAEVPEVPVPAPEVQTEGIPDTEATGTDKSEATPDYKALLEASRDELAKAEQRANSAEGRLKNVVTRDDLGPINTELRRMRLLEELRDEDPEERREQIAAFDSEQKQTQTQAHLNSRGNRIQQSIARKMAAVGIEANDPRLQEAVDLWAMGVTDGQVTDTEPLLDALEVIDRITGELQSEVTAKAVEVAKASGIAEAQGKNLTDETLDLGISGASGGGTSIQEKVNRFGSGEPMSMKDMIEVNEAMGNGMLPKA